MTHEKKTTARRGARWGLRGAVAASTMALMLLAGQLPAGAAAVTGPGGAVLSVTTGTTSPVASFTDNTTYITASSAGYVRTDGSNYNGQFGFDDFGYNVGVYVVYGPREADYRTNGGWYYSAAWVPGSQIVSGAWANRQIQIAPTYSANPVHGEPALTVDCRWNYAHTQQQNEANGKRKCYVQTFTAHGFTPDSPNELRDDAQLEVRW